MRDPVRSQHRVGSLQLSSVEWPSQSGAPCVVGLHGMTGDGLDFQPLVDATPGLRWIAADLPGHGRTGWPTSPYGMDALARDLTEWLSRLGEKRVLLVGYSMGGRIALTLASHARLAPPARESIAGLVLVGASAGIVDPGARRQRRQADDLWAEQLEREGVAPFLGQWQAQPLLASQANIAQPHRRAMDERRRTADARGWADAFRGLGTGAMPALADHLAEITTPCLTVAGRLDERYSAIAGELARALPSAQAALIEGVGHAAHLEDPRAFSRLMLDFVDSLFKHG